MWNEEDLLEMTKEEFCEKFGITSEEWELLQKQYQEV